ncbi:actin-related protein 2/3 complex subunit 5-C-like [Artemia franciscana]|uniref:Actin-related protein 2/3 complex subunit 5 n=1 Tax=Artemia franciscana TaxID=6661 RepID=A0AA88I1B9_ARTSF|nr:hypothetical protein QYM36_005142 [Artemia franciscana]KAK2719570.1 hypothetical protein QYM36_005142 [Artemia franciscana]KAK2719571.1 hypothetical protein QYM36_005142 [Artemia franciscana]
MAKSTLNTEFRKLDVDKYCEDNYLEEELQTVSQQPGQAEEISKLLSLGKNIDALKLILKNVPLSGKRNQAQDVMYSLALRAILSIKISQLDEFLGSLDKESLEILMKYVYKGFESPSEGSSGQLLNWHERIVGICGVGSVVRVMTDKLSV